MLVSRTYKFRIYPTLEQSARLLAWEHALRFLWNLAHEQRLMGLSRSSPVFPSAFDQSAELTDLRAELEWLQDVPRSAAEQVLASLDTAWVRCFVGLARRPRWKRKGAPIGVGEPHHDRWRITKEGVVFPKLGTLRTVFHRSPEGAQKTCTVIRDGDQWFVALSYEHEVALPAPRSGPVVAVDRGVIYTLATSDGRLVANPRHYETSMKRLARAQRVVSRRKKGSRNREKAKARVMQLARKVRRQREHFLHVESARLAKSHGVVVIEKLNIAGMVRGNCSRGIAGAGWAGFARMLRYKLGWSGGTLVEVPAAYSSQTCAQCGSVDARYRQGEKFTCACGNADHADVNAAKVLKTRASRSGLPVEGKVPKTTRRSRKLTTGTTPSLDH